MKRNLMIAAACVSMLLILGVGCKSTSTTQTTTTTGTPTSGTTTESSTEETTEEPTTETTKKVSDRAILPTPTPTPVPGLSELNVYRVDPNDDRHKIWETTEYYENGLIVKREHDGGRYANKVETYEYDSEGRMISTSGSNEYSAGTSTWTEELTYDENGLLIHSVRTAYYLEDNGFGSQDKFECVTTRDYTYDEDGFILEYKSIDTSKNADIFLTRTHEVYEYDEDGRLLTKTQYDISSMGDESVRYLTEYTCDEEGKILTEVVYDYYYDEPEMKTYSYEYDDAGNVSTVTYDYGVIVYYYNEYGLVEKVESTYSFGDDSSTRTETTVYEYTIN